MDNFKWNVGVAVAIRFADPAIQLPDNYGTFINEVSLDVERQAFLLSRALLAASAIRHAACETKKGRGELV